MIVVDGANGETVRASQTPNAGIPHRESAANNPSDLAVGTAPSFRHGEFEQKETKLTKKEFWKGVLLRVRVLAPLSTGVAVSLVRPGVRKAARRRAALQGRLRLRNRALFWSEILRFLL
jgi:hypothetical protein